MAQPFGKRNRLLPHGGLSTARTETLRLNPEQMATPGIPLCALDTQTCRETPSFFAHWKQMGFPLSGPFRIDAGEPLHVRIEPFTVEDDRRDGRWPSARAFARSLRTR